MYRTAKTLTSSDSSSSIIVPSYATYRENRPQVALIPSSSNRNFQSAPGSSWDESNVSMIKFSAKDGKSAMASTGIPRESLMETQRKVIQFEAPEPGAQYRSPRKIKMGSFIKPRSLAANEDGKTDGVYIQVCFNKMHKWILIIVVVP